MKFLHAADLHIDSPLGGLRAYEGAPVEAIRGATRRATENLVNAALRHEVDLVVIAGDIFDGEWRDYSTGLFWVGQLNRLQDAGIPVVLVAGNHDAASEISRHLKLPPNVSQLDTNKPEVRIFDQIDVAVVGQGYATRAVTSDLSDGFPSPDSGLFNIGLLHTSLDGRPGHARYAPTTVEALRSKGYDYWALGHVHERETVHNDPWILFPGNLQGRHARELGAKGAVLVTVESNVVTDVEFIALDDVRWTANEVDITDMADIDAVLAAVERSLVDTAVVADNALTAVRLTLVGESAAHEQLWRDPRGFEAHAQAIASSTGRLWLEKTKIVTSDALPESRANDDEIVALVAERVRQLRFDPAAVAEYEPMFADLRRKIGADARSSDGAAVDTLALGTSKHLAAQLGASVELIKSLLAEGEK